MKNKFFKKSEIEEFVKLAILFEKNRNLIINNWVISHDSINISKFKYMQKGIEILLDSFIINLKVGNIDKYLEENHEIGRLVTSKDIPYDLFLDSFHEFEGSYFEILVQYYGKNNSDPFTLLDKLHHKTISILAKEYFEIRDKTIFAMAKLAEYRDPETGFHLERTREYSKLIAKYLECSSDFVQHLYNVSPLHDIGKIGIPDKILLKKSKLSKEEYKIMKTHAKIGGDTLNSIIKENKITAGNLIMGREIAYYHHEKFDGSGYYGLKELEIPLSARIFLIVDIYDALTSKRSYKEAFSHKEAFEIITKGDGRVEPTDFDPRVLDAFIKIEKYFVEILNKFNE